VPAHDTDVALRCCPTGTLFIYTRNEDGSWASWGKTGGGEWGRSNSDLEVGWSVAQDGPFQAAGAPKEGSNTGAAYVKEHGAQPRGFVVEPDTSSGDRFGSSVALAWPYLAVGAPDGALNAGFLYKFENQNQTWSKVGSRIDSQSAGWPTLVGLGKSVAVSADGKILVGGEGGAILQIRS
jgi:hypothetical protein